MKYHYLLTFLILTTGMIMTSCKDAESERIRREARAALPEVQPGTVAPPPAPTAPTTASTSLEPHYKCPNNCVGGTGSAAGSCPVCGTELAHNTAYHNQSAATTPPAPAITPGATPQTPAAASNAAGVFHYTCSNGCAGGAGSQGVCATCGATLVHNTAYHSQSAIPAAGTTTPSLTPQTATPQAPAAAQNASGVFHYTCSSGCAGGAGSAVACSTCGATLVHNTAYHN